MKSMKVAEKAEFPGDRPTGKKRRFLVTVSRTREVELDESVIAQGMADDGYIAKNPTEEQVLQHLGFNLFGNGIPLGHIEGYANCPDASAECIGLEDSEVEVTETTKVRLPSKRGRRP